MPKAQICMISFPPCTQVFGIPKALIQLRDRSVSFSQLYAALKISTCMNIVETEIPLSELKIFPNYKET